MNLETYNKAEKILKRIEVLTSHLYELNSGGIIEDMPLAIKKTVDREVILKPNFFNYDEFIEKYKAGIEEELFNLNLQFENIQ